MTEFLDVTLLAILQGVAEFLPISSSGHLVIGQSFLGVNAPGMRLDVFLHVGTLVAIFAYYAQITGRLLRGIFSPHVVLEMRRVAWRYVGNIVLSAVPAIVVYVFAKDALETAFESVRAVGGLLIITGVVLSATRFLPQGENEISPMRAFVMGLAQAVALLPGISRSGMTLVAARFLRVSSERAAEFSFLMSAPLIAGAALLEFIKCFQQTAAAAVAQEPSWGLTLYGAALAGVVGYFSLALLVKTLRGRWFWLFGPYCILAGIITLIFS